MKPILPGILYYHISADKTNCLYIYISLVFTTLPFVHVKKQLAVCCRLQKSSMQHSKKASLTEHLKHLNVDVVLFALNSESRPGTVNSQTQASLKWIRQRHKGGYTVCKDELSQYRPCAQDLPVLLFPQGTYLTVCHY